MTNRNSRVASLIAWAKTLFGYENRVCLKDKSLQDQWDLQTEQIWIRENSSKLMFWLLGGHIVWDFLFKQWIQKRGLGQVWGRYSVTSNPVSQHSKSTQCRRKPELTINYSSRASTSILRVPMKVGFRAKVGFPFSPTGSRSQSQLEVLTGDWLRSK